MICIKKPLKNGDNIVLRRRVAPDFETVARRHKQAGARRERESEKLQLSLLAHL